MYTQIIFMLLNNTMEAFFQNAERFKFRQSSFFNPLFSVSLHNFCFSISQTVRKACISVNNFVKRPHWRFHQESSETNRSGQKVQQCRLPVLLCWGGALPTCIPWSIVGDTRLRVGDCPRDPPTYNTDIGLNIKLVSLLDKSDKSICSDP